MEKKRKITVGILTLFLVSLTLGQGRALAAGEKKLVPIGRTIGIQVFTDGVLVVGLSAGESDKPSPAAEAGILPGDLIVGVGRNEVHSAVDFKKAVEALDGTETTVRIARNGETIDFQITPTIKSGVVELGMWLRDSIGGIGTLTFYDPETGCFGGLGHSISDNDTGVMLPLGSGHIMSSKVTEVKKGCAGEPGELCGAPNPDNVIGDILFNTRCGIFGSLDLEVIDLGEAISVADSDEIELGAATILANVTGSEIEEFDVDVIRVYRGDQNGRGMMIAITDKRLLELTGGIVQGMSGSPILQDGKLIGAVTHVLVNDPTRGFGVSMEEMVSVEQGTRGEKKVA